MPTQSQSKRKAPPSHPIRTVSCPSHPPGLPGSTGLALTSHLCSLVLKPDLDHTHAEACLCCQRLSYLTRREGDKSGLCRWQLEGGSWVEGWEEQQTHNKQKGALAPHCPPSTPHLPTGLGGDLKRGLKSSSLLGSEDGPGPFGPSRVLPVISTALTLATLPLGRLHVSVFVLTLHCGRHNPTCQSELTCR